jgi:hypothetical protein
LAVTGAVLGHSFVHSFSHYLEKHVGHVTPSFSHVVATQLKVYSHVQRVHLIGKRGASVHNLFSPHQIRRINPIFVIIDCGSNDLADPNSCPLQVASAIVDLAHHLIKHYRVKHVVICSIIDRQARLGGQTPEQFKDKAYRCNNYLYHFCDVEPDITYHTHRGFWNSPISHWSHDKIHPNAPPGRKKYAASLTRAIFDMIRSRSLSN